jgi:hypothetical protein
MVQGNKKINIDLDDLLFYTDGGREIYEHYLGRISRLMHRPWGTDAHPSWGVFPNEEGIWIWKDLATEEKGNAISFVQRLFELSYADALSKVYFDFDLGSKEVISDRVYKVQKSQPKKYKHITAITTKFSKRHHEFWNAAEVTEDLCKAHNCFAVKKLAIDRVVFPIKPEERVFVYYANDIKKVKVYFPDRQGMDRFRTNVQYSYLWEYSTLKPCDKLVIHKSMKDLIVFSQLFPNNIATQNESIKIFDEETVNKINQISPEPWVFYGSDNDGVRKCTEITNTNGWKYINTPKEELPEVNDIYGFVKKHGLKKLEEFIKLKGL